MPIPLLSIASLVKKLLSPEGIKLALALFLVTLVVGASIKGGHYIGTLSASKAGQEKLDAKEKERRDLETEVNRLQGEVLTAKAKAETALAQALSDVATERERSEKARKKLLAEFLAKRHLAPGTTPSVGVPVKPTLAERPPCFNTETIEVINSLLENSNATGFFAPASAP